MTPEIIQGENSTPHSTLIMLPYSIFIIFATILCINGLERIDLNSWKGKTVLFISAHPDDIEATCGGTVSFLTSQQTNVHFLIATNGDKGCSNNICQNMTNSQIANTRRTEEKTAASILGVKAENIHYLGYEDSELIDVPSLLLQKKVVGFIRSLKPEAIFTWYPYPQFELKPLSLWGDLGYHPDHQYIGKVALDARGGAGVGRLFPEMGNSWNTPYFFFVNFSKDKVTHFVDISAVIEKKTQSFLAHKTQYSDPNFIKKLVSALGFHSAKLVNQSKINYAETFLGYF